MKNIGPERTNKLATQILIFCIVALITGCGAGTEFSVENLVKTDINQVSDIHIDQSMVLLKTLTRKLYKMNSIELAKTPGATITSQINRIFQCPPPLTDPVLSDQSGTDAILLGFDPRFRGDRVYAVMYGLYTMLHSAYSGKCNLFMLDFLDAQNLYNSARNIEILIWRLKNRHQEDGTLYLTTNICNGPVENLSFERLFGKLISLQDTMALIVASRNNRIIKEAVHMAGMAFLPIGI